jgi:hypothetical protein
MVGKTACSPYICALAILFAMSRYRRADIPGATYFFTVATYRRRPILCDDSVRAALRDAVKTVQARHPYHRCLGFVARPPALHLDIAVGRRWLSTALGLDKTDGFFGLLPTISSGGLDDGIQSKKPLPMLA